MISRMASMCSAISSAGMSSSLGPSAAAFLAASASAARRCFFHGLVGLVDEVLTESGDGDDVLLGNILGDEVLGASDVILTFDLGEEALDARDLGEFGGDGFLDRIELRLIDPETIEDGLLGDVVFDEIPDALVVADLARLGDEEVEPDTADDCAEITASVEVLEVGEIVSDIVSQGNGRLHGICDAFEGECVDGGCVFGEQGSADPCALIHSPAEQEHVRRVSGHIVAIGVEVSGELLNGAFLGAAVEVGRSELGNFGLDGKPEWLIGGCCGGHRYSSQEHFLPRRDRPDVVACEEYLKFKIQDESASQYFLESRRTVGWRVMWKRSARTER